MRLPGLCSTTLLCLCIPIAFVSSAHAAGCNVAIWANGGTDSGGNNVDTWLNSFGCTTTFVTNAQIDVPGFLHSFDAIFVTRQGDSFGTGGTGMDAAGAKNVRAYVRGHGTAGRVILFLNDWVDDNPFNNVGDPPDPNSSAVMQNAILAAAASGHGYVGELNGASMALKSNQDGFTPIGLFLGSATSPDNNGIPCDAVTQVRAHGIGVGDFQPLAVACFGVNTTGIGTKHIVYEYTSGEPAVIDNYPRPFDLSLVSEATANAAPSRHALKPASEQHTGARSTSAGR